MKKDLLICVLAMTWVWGLIWYLGRRKHPYERPDSIDREFRELVGRSRVCVQGNLESCRCGGTPVRNGQGHENSGSCTCCRDTCLGTGQVHNVEGRPVCECPAQWAALSREAARVFPHAHDEHGASSYSPDVIDQANRAHTTGQVRCPIHGSACGRAARARRTGLSQTDDDGGRRAASGQSAH